MTRKFILVLTVLSILAMLFAMAATPPPTKFVRLTATYYSKISLIMRLDAFGFTKKDSLAASILVDKVMYPISCQYDDTKHITCVAPGLNRVSGKPARLWVALNTFFFKVPAH